MEEWRDVVGYEGIYQISNLGRIKSIRCRGHIREKILKPYVDGKGYLFITLCKDGKRKECRIHNLVATMFIQKPSNAQCVNHKNGNKKDNCVNNLEWCTFQQNIIHSRTQLGNIPNPPKKVIQKNLDGEILKIWDSGLEVQKYLGIWQPSLSRVCRNGGGILNGFFWSYFEMKGEKKRDKESSC